MGVVVFIEVLITSKLSETAMGASQSFKQFRNRISVCNQYGMATSMNNFLKQNISVLIAYSHVEVKVKY